MVGELNPKVSVGIPVYNGETFLAETIDCLLAQSYEDFEVVISDNASTDSTEEICRSYLASDPRVRYERQAINQGAPWNYNRVFELARGSYFRWAAHDDLCSSTFLARCVEVLDFNPSIVWCQSRIGVIDRFGQTVYTSGCDLSGAAEVLILEDGQPPKLADNADNISMRFAHQRFRNVLLGNTACFDIYGLIRSEVLRETSLWKPCFGWEKVLLSGLALRGKCAEIPEELFYFRIHEEACSAKETLEEESAWSNPGESKSKLNGMVRLQLFNGHLRNVFEAPIGFWSRANCLASLGAYLLQFRKWRSVLPQILGNTGMGGSTRKTLEKRVEFQTKDVV
jgi:glycosyltransferase involved in cell wall biosynthesis